MEINIRFSRLGIAIMFVALFSQFDSSFASQFVFMVGFTLYIVFGGFVTVTEARR